MLFSALSDTAHDKMPKMPKIKAKNSEQEAMVALAKSERLRSARLPSYVVRALVGSIMWFDLIECRLRSSSILEFYSNANLHSK